MGAIADIHLIKQKFDERGWSIPSSIAMNKSKLLVLFNDLIAYHESIGNLIMIDTSNTVRILSFVNSYLSANKLPKIKLLEDEPK